MQVLTSFPKSSVSSGMLQFPVSSELLGRFELTIYTIGALALYPIIALIAIISQIYLALNSLHHSLKIKKHAKPIPIEDERLEILRDERILKLDGRLSRIPLSVKDLTPSEKEALIKNYEAVKPTDYTEAMLKGNLKRAVAPIILYNRLMNEKAAYETSISEALIKRHTFAKLRHQVAIKVNMHYLKNLCKILIPVIGFLWLLKSKETTEVFFKKAPNKALVDQYNQMIRETTWLKPF